MRASLALTAVSLVSLQALAAPTVLINDGAAWTASPAVTITVRDAGPYAQMCVSETAKCTVFEPLVASKAWTLKGGNGTRTVTVSFRADAQTASAKANIRLDQQAPSGGKLTATHGNAQNLLSWTAFQDAGSGVASYRVMGAAGIAAPPCTGVPLYEGTDRTYQHTGLTNGTLYAYRVCASDKVGNLSTGLSGSEQATAQPRPESDAPTGTLTINEQAPLTALPTVRLSVGATDASGVTSMCVTEKTICKAWEAYRATLTFTLSGQAGLKTVRVWLRDQWGNAAKDPTATATITLDNKPPVGGTVQVTPCRGGADLTWSGFTDQPSGVASYSVVVVQGRTPPASCTGTISYSGGATSYSLKGLINGVSYGFAVCATDTLGNTMRRGVTGRLTPTPETFCAGDVVDDSASKPSRYDEAQWIVPNPKGATDPHTGKLLPNQASYTVTTDTVLDNVTGLMWQRRVPALKSDWLDARDYCENLTLAGYTDWRLPSEMELGSIVNYQTHDPAIDKAAFPDTPSEWFWVSYAVLSVRLAGMTNFYDGQPNYGDSYRANRVRCVR